MLIKQERGGAAPDDLPIKTQAANNQDQRHAD